MPLDDSLIYRLFKILQADTITNQRDLAGYLGVSLGKMNYCLKSLSEKGWIKAEKFMHSSNKKGYAYIITPKGLEEKTKVTLRFLQRKIEEYETIQKDIAELREELLR